MSAWSKEKVGISKLSGKTRFFPAQLSLLFFYDLNFYLLSGMLPDSLFRHDAFWQPAAFVCEWILLLAVLLGRQGRRSLPCSMALSLSFILETAMIIYDDIRRIPLFKPFFEASGVHHANHCKGPLTFFLYKTCLGRRMTPDRLFADPHCTADDDMIIVFDTHTTPRYMRWLRRRYPDKRILLWYWNPVPQGANPQRMTEFGEIWSYCERDAKTWGMRRNTQFFFDSLAEEAAECASSQAALPPRALFIGRDKGRSAQLAALRKELEEVGVAVDYRLLPRPRVRVVPSLFEKLIPYREVIEAVKASTILIDLYADPNAGLSLRAMEALFFGRKLVTNRKLMRGEDFYAPENIYILGEEDRTLAEFLAEPCCPPDPAVRDCYLLSRWIERFRTEERDL